MDWTPIRRAPCTEVEEAPLADALWHTSSQSPKTQVTRTRPTSRYRMSLPQRRRPCIAGRLLSTTTLEAFETRYGTVCTDRARSALGRLHSRRKSVKLVPETTLMIGDDRRMSGDRARISAMGRISISLLNYATRFYALRGI